MKDVLERWRECGVSLLKNENATGHTQDLNTDELLPAVTESEVIDAMKRLPNKKATGYDGLPAEVLKAEM